MIVYDYMPSPLGEVLLLAEQDALIGVYFVGQKYCPQLMPEWLQDDQAPVIVEAKQQIEEFFSGRRCEFSVPLRLVGTDFQEKVWRELAAIPFGTTVSYAWVAQKLELDRRFSRAVGSAIGRNPILLFIPCHRVLASSGHLTGYAGGLQRKQKLLALESGNSIMQELNF